MNILVITKNDWLKSVVYDIHVFAEALSLLGHQVYAIDLVRVKKREVKNVARAFPKAKVELRRTGSIRLPSLSPLPISLIPGLNYLSFTIANILEIHRTIRNKNIDVILLYSVVAHSLWGIRLARWFHIPVIFRSIDALYNLESSPRKRDAVKALERRVYSQVDAVLAISPGYSEYVINMGAPEAKVKLLLFPIDTRIFRPSIDCGDIRQRWGLTERDKVVVFVGTLYEFGGLGELIRRFPEMIREIPEAKLLIVGDGPMRPELERIIDDLGLKKSVIITGYQPFETMPQYINLASVCICPFNINDTTRYIFSGKIIQYLACAKVVVASPVPGMTSLIPGESCGVVYADNTADMVGKIVNLLDSAERREQLGQAGLDYVKRNHSYDKIVCRLETILREVITEKHSIARSKEEPR